MAADRKNHQKTSFILVSKAEKNNYVNENQFSFGSAVTCVGSIFLNVKKSRLVLQIIIVIIQRYAIIAKNSKLLH